MCSVTKAGAEATRLLGAALFAATAAGAPATCCDFALSFRVHCCKPPPCFTFCHYALLSLTVSIFSVPPAKTESCKKCHTDSEKQYIEQAAAKTKGSSKLVARQVVNGKAYFLYSLSNATYKSARTTVQKVDGKWKVTDFSISTKTLELLPGTSETSQSEDASPNNNTACLVPTDFDAFFREINGAARPLSLDYTKVDYTNNVHFNADALTFSAPEKANTDMIAAFANFAKQNRGKMFSIHLRGSVGTTVKADLDFATRRANKVRDLLVAQGVSNSFIVIDAPGSVSDYGSGSSNAANQQSARDVVLTITAACSAAVNSTGR